MNHNVINNFPCSKSWKYSVQRIKHHNNIFSMKQDRYTLNDGNNDNLIKTHHNTQKMANRHQPQNETTVSIGKST